MFRRPKGTHDPSLGDDGAGIYLTLRSQALNLDPASIGLSPTADLPRVVGVVMDMTYPNGGATLVAIADNTTSLYTSTGGGTIGGGDHASVAAVNRQLLTTSEAELDRFRAADRVELPRVGGVRITVLTYAGRRTIEARADDLGEGRHPASAVFHAAHEVIHALQMIDGRPPGGGSQTAPG